MDNKVNFREIKVYQSDDGRKIQHFTLEGEVASKTGPSDNLPFSHDDITEQFIGLNVVSHPMVGNRYISFVIKGASNIYEAFDLYDGFYEKAFNKESAEINKMLQDYIDKNPDCINKIDKEDLDKIYKNDKQGSIISE